MKQKLLVGIVTCTCLATSLFGQGNYKNNLLIYPTVVNSSIIARDIETFPSNTMVTGLFPLATNVVPGVNNNSVVSRIFITDYKTGTFAFNKVYLMGAGLDIGTVNKVYSYTVNEIKQDNNGFVVCGSITKGIAPTFNEAFILNVDNIGNVNWFKRYTVANTFKTEFNSIEPIKVGGVITGFINCGYRIDSLGVRKAIACRVDTNGVPISSIVQLNEAPILGVQPNSEFKKVIVYDATNFALVGYCNQKLDTLLPCRVNGSCDILFSMFNISSNSLLSKAIGTGAFTNFDKQSDEGISIIKSDTELIILSKYYNANGIICPNYDLLGNLIQVNTAIPTNIATWQLKKSIKYNTLVNSNLDIPKDLLLDPTATATNRRLFVCGNYNATKSYLINPNFSLGNNVSFPKVISNFSGGLTDDITIDLNTPNRVIGIANSNKRFYSLYENANSSKILCSSDTIFFPYPTDTMKWANKPFINLVPISNLQPHVAFNFNVIDSLLCDSVTARYASDLDFESKISKVTVVPNPFSISTSIIVDNTSNDDVNMYLFDCSGRPVLNYNKDIINHRGITKINLEMRNLLLGLYLCKVIVGHEVHYVKLVKE
jgi:hypothetical protein